MKCEYMCCAMNKNGVCSLKEVSMDYYGRCSFAWYGFRSKSFFGEHPTTSEELNVGFNIFPREPLPDSIKNAHPRLKYEVKKYFTEHPEAKPEGYSEDF